MSAELNLPAQQPRQASMARFLKSHMRDYGMLISLLAIVAFFQYMTGGTLLQPLNLTNLVLQNSYIVIMALGMLLVIVAGHIDLSVGSIVGFIGALAAILMVQFHLHFIPTAILCLLAGAAIGAAQGYWVAYFRIPSFIVTLAGMLVFRGLSLALAGRPVGRPLPGGVPAPQLRLHPRPLRHRRLPHHDAAALPGDAGDHDRLQHRRPAAPPALLPSSRSRCRCSR